MTRPYGDAIQDAAGGVFIDVDVAPGAREDRFPDGYDPWRRRIGVRVRAPAEDGRANRAVAATVAAFFGRAAHEVDVVGGPTSRHKRLWVRGVTRADVVARLEVLA